MLAKTISLEGRKLETQVLHCDGRTWNGYSYLWNKEQTDAALAPPEGAEVDLGGGRKWKVPSRTACVTCHNSWAGYAIAFNVAQLIRSKPLVNPSDENGRLDDRARSYLSVNCAHCHSSGSARIDLRHDIPLKKTQMEGIRPSLGGFDLTDALLIAPGDPSRSVLLYRMAKLGQGRMPHIGSDRVDEQGVRLLSRPTGALDLLAILEMLPESTRLEAIRRALHLPPGLVRDLFERFESPGNRRKRLGTLIQPEGILSLKGDLERGRRLFTSETVQCSKCHHAQGLGAELSKIGTRYSRAQLLEAILEPSKTINPKDAGYILQTKGGEVYSGILVSKTEKEIVLRDADKEIRLKTGDVEKMVPQQKSLMPEGLLQHLTAQEAADLLTYLESLR